MQRAENPYQQIVVSPNGKYVACNCGPLELPDDLDSENALCIWDVDHGRWMKRRVEKLSEQVRFKFSPNGRYLAVFGSGQDLVLFNTENHSEQRFVNPDHNYFDDVNFDRDENLVGAVATSGDVDVLSTRDLSRLSHLPIRKSVGEIAFSRDGKKLLTHSWNHSYANSERWEVWELDNNRLIKEACWIMKSYKFHEPQIDVCKAKEQ